MFPIASIEQHMRSLLAAGGGVEQSPTFAGAVSSSVDPSLIAQGYTKITPILQHTVTNDSTGPTGTKGGSAAVFLNKMFYFPGGTYADVNTQYEEIHTSVDGVTWTLTMDAATTPWGTLQHHRAIVFNGLLWFMGGENINTGDDTRSDEVWSSPDGITWTLRQATAPWGSRSNFALCEFNGKLWLMGGKVGTGGNGVGDAPATKKDVWSSVDGVTWVLEATPPWTVRYDCQAVVFDGKMWLLGGISATATKLPDVVWSTPDGTNWTQVTPTVPWNNAGATGLCLATTDGIWIQPTSNNNNSAGTVNELWFSRDGVEWTLCNINLPGFEARTKSAAGCYYQGKLWTIGFEYYGDSTSHGVKRVESFQPVFLHQKP